MVSHLLHPEWSTTVAAGLLGFAAGYLLTHYLVRQQLAVLRVLANSDPLTGLPNRRALIAEVTGRLAARQPTALVLIDLDDFKTVNDTWGHLAGDDLLVTIAHRLRAAAPTGYVARLAGDEFVLLIPEQPDIDPTGPVTDVLAHLAEPVHLGAATLRPRASAGVATTGHTGSSWRGLIRRADHALYQAKQSPTRRVAMQRDNPPGPSRRRHRDD
jgi:diguanylate cyclase (GGDEF)-like protein